MYSINQAAGHGQRTSAWEQVGASRTGAGIKTYRLHDCNTNHRTGSAMARCIWGSNARVEGQGAYAVVHRLKVGRSPRYADILLYDNENEARAQFEAMSQPFYCGGSCRNAGGRHDLVRLDLQNQERKS